jgi:hypothetical protein
MSCHSLHSFFLQPIWVNAMEWRTKKSTTTRSSVRLASTRYALFGLFQRRSMRFFLTISFRRVYLEVVKVFSPDPDLFEPLPKPRKGDWLAEHAEPGLAFDLASEKRLLTQTDMQIYARFLLLFSQFQDKRCSRSSVASCERSRIAHTELFSSRFRCSRLRIFCRICFACF